MFLIHVSSTLHLIFYFILITAKRDQDYCPPPYKLKNQGPQMLASFSSNRQLVSYGI